MAALDDPAQIQRKLARLAELESLTADLRHDIRGMLSPALLVADRLLGHADPRVTKAGETVIKSIRRAEERLKQTKQPGG